MGDCQSKNRISAVDEPVKDNEVDERVPRTTSGTQPSARLQHRGNQTDPLIDPIKEIPVKHKPEYGRSGGMREIISIHIGQAGVQIGNSCWELFCLGPSFSSFGISMPQKISFKFS